MPNTPKAVSRRQAEQLDQLYAELPTIACQGMCWDSCGPIEMTVAERERISRAGVDIPQGSYLRDGPALCPALTMLHQCSVYEIRPLICRIWGMTRRMRCNFGCKPDRYLSEPEAYEFIARAMEISGEHRNAKVARNATLPEHQERLRQAHACIAEETALKWGVR
jgi:Fe-S-cluster containining protein